MHKIILINHNIFKYQGQPIGYFEKRETNYRLKDFAVISDLYEKLYCDLEHKYFRNVYSVPILHLSLVITLI
jgi:hypothetical protein